jgi:hypothetical protein
MAVVYPRIISTDLNDLRLLASFGETGSFGGLATCSRPLDGEENHGITGGKFLHSSRGDAHALDFTRYDTDGEVGNTRDFC